MSPREWRHALGLSQTKLAERLGLSMRHLRRIELGEWPTPPMLKILTRLVKKPGQLKD